MGVMNTVIVFILLKTTPLSVFAVAGVSSALGIIKNLTFTPMYAAHCLKISKRSFYPVIIRYILVSALMCGLFFGMGIFLPSHTWLWLIVDVAACGIAGCIINFLLLFGKRERTVFTDMIMKRMGKKNAGE